MLWQPTKKKGEKTMLASMSKSTTYLSCSALTPFEAPSANPLPLFMYFQIVAVFLYFTLCDIICFVDQWLVSQQEVGTVVCLQLTLWTVHTPELYFLFLVLPFPVSIPSECLWLLQFRCSWITHGKGRNSFSYKNKKKLILIIQKFFFKHWNKHVMRFTVASTIHTSATTTEVYWI